MNDDFYIGWSNENPASYQRNAKRFFFATLLIFLVISVVFTSNENGFIDSYFEFGTLQKRTGYLVNKPVWGLRTLENGKIKTIPLVGFGKYGATNTIQSWLKSNNILVEGAKITVQGTLFRYKDKEWMELTQMENSLIEVEYAQVPQQEVKTLGYQSFLGEIVDPKCFFGVMNPANQAVHRSCAIRCIAGGIPPVLALRSNGAFNDYYFLVDEEMSTLNLSLLPYIGIPIQVSGQAIQYDDWKMLKIRTDELKIVSHIAYTPLTLCDADNKN